MRVRSKTDATFALLTRVDHLEFDRKWTFKIPLPSGTDIASAYQISTQRPIRACVIGSKCIPSVWREYRGVGLHHGQNIEQPSTFKAIVLLQFEMRAAQRRTRSKAKFRTCCSLYPLKHLGG